MVRRVALALVTLVVAVLALAGPASAHAQLVDTDPQGGAVLAEAPKHVTLHFAERVEIALGAMRLYDANGREIRLGAASHVNGDDTRVTVSLPALDPGAYAVAWRVVSADSHPVAGAFTFQIGSAAAAPAAGVLQRLLADNGGDSTVGALLALARFGAFASLAVLVGGLAFVVLVWPAGASSRPARRVLWWALGSGVVVTAAGIALQGPYATGRGLGDAFQPGEWTDVLSTQAGKAWGIRGLLLLVGGAALIATLRRARDVVWQVAALAVGIAVGVAFAYSGHGSTGRWPFLATVLTVAHLGAMGVWVGGLVMLLVVALAARGDGEARAGPDADADADAGAGAGGPDEGIGATDPLSAARRFSSLAFGAVIAVVATGVVQGYRQVGGIDELTSTHYGRLLLLKTAAVAAVVALGGLSRRVLNTRGARRPEPQPVSVGAAAAPVAVRPVPAGPGEARRLLRRVVGGEVVVAVVVLGLTSLLVAAPPAIEAKAVPFSATILQGDRQASITVEPAARGRNTLHVYLFTTRGSLDRAKSITVRVTQPEHQFGPLDVLVLDGGPNHVTTDDLQLPFTGQWQLEVLATFGADGSQVVRFATSFTAR